jgi:lysophospholipase L1-like esterase
MKKISLALLAFTIISVIASEAHACPAVGNLPDVNCDGSARVAVLGDSVVYGVGDTINGGKGGYVLRVAKRFPNATFDNLGTPGEQARRVIGIIESSFAGTGDPDFAASLTKADIVILDIGRNDWWKFGPASATWRNLKRIREVIQNEVKKVTGHKPLVVTAQIMGANRTGQGTWVAELNTLIAANSKPTSPGDLKFNSVSKKLLLDRVHPSPVGYDRIAKILFDYLSVKLPKHVVIFREDVDNDGLYDEYEVERFGTSPTDPDSDDDGILDGADETPV